MITHHDVSIHINASPATIYAMVSDIARHGEWSGQAVTCEWVDPEQTGLGAQFYGHNRSHERGEWTTTSQVIAAEPHKRFAWQVGGGVVVWSFEIEPENGGARLTQTWDLDPAFTLALFTERYGDVTLARAEIAKREADARTSMMPTLERIKAIAER